jgi:hypothetical protein
MSREARLFRQALVRLCVALSNSKRISRPGGYETRGMRVSAWSLKLLDPSLP